MRIVVLTLELLAVVLFAAAAGVGVTEVVGLWAGLLSAGAVVLAAAVRGELQMTGGEHGAAMGSPATRR